MVLVQSRSPTCANWLRSTRGRAGIVVAVTVIVCGGGGVVVIVVVVIAIARAIK